MLCRLGLIWTLVLWGASASAQERSGQRPCNDDNVRTAIIKYFEKPASLAGVVAQNQVILALLAPSPLASEKSSVTVLGQRQINDADFSCLVEYRKVLSYKDAVLYGRQMDLNLNLTVKATFDLQRYGSEFTVTERERLESAVNVLKENGEPLDAMGLDQNQEQVLLEKSKPMSPEGRAEFWKHPAGTAEENAKILNSPFPGQNTPATPAPSNLTAQPPGLPAPPTARDPDGKLASRGAASVASPSNARLPSLSTEFDACLKSHSRNADWSACSEQEVSRQEKALQDIWNETYVGLKHLGGPSAQMLLDEQRAWVKFKDSACLFYNSPVFGREGAVVQLGTCKAAIIAQRIGELRAISQAAKM